VTFVDMLVSFTAAALRPQPQALQPSLDLLANESIGLVAGGAGRGQTRTSEHRSAPEQKVRCQFRQEKHEGPAIDGVNIVYIKAQKTASSTTSGMLRRIAANHGLGGYRSCLWWKTEPLLWANHGSWHLVEPEVTSLKLPTVLIASVREPAARAMSEYYHFCVNMPMEKSVRLAQNGVGGHVCDVDKLKFLKTVQDFMVNYAGSETAWSVLQRYDRVIVAERFDESAVDLATYLGLPISHVLYSTSKESHHPPVEAEPADVQTYLNTTFKRRNSEDVKLHQLADKALTARYARNPSMRAALVEFQSLRKRSEAECQGSAMESKSDFLDEEGLERLNVPATSNQSTSGRGRLGLREECEVDTKAGGECGDAIAKASCSCYWGDNGCDFKCHDQLVQRVCT